MKKNVLFVIDSLNCGGAEKSLISLLSLIDYDKYDVDLQLYNPTGMFKKLVPNEVEILPNIDFYDFCTMSLNRQLCSLKFNKIISKIKYSYYVRNNKEELHGAQLFWKNCSKCIGKLEKKYDIAIAYNQGFSTYFVGEKVNADKKLAWVNVNYINAAYNPKLDIKYYNNFDKIVAVSKRVEDILIECFPQYENKIDVMYDINNAELIKKMSDEFDVYTDIEKDKIKLVTVGRLVHQKGYDIALEACKTLVNHGMKFEWNILGDGNEMKSIEAYIKQNNLGDYFKLLGTVENPYPYIKNSDIYVQTSKSEGFGLAIAEARILNIPIVTTNFDAVYNQMIEEKNGLVVDMDGKSVADGISRLIYNRKLRKDIINYLKKEKKGNIDELNKFYSLVN